GVGGWRLAEIEGRIAGLAVAAAHRVPLPGSRRGPSLDGVAVPGVLLRRRRRMRAFAEALLEAYPIRPGWRGWLRDDTVVCRCEEVPLARVREALDLGATDARSVKLLARAGMGWCQGRICGYPVACLAGEPPGPPRRPIAQPVSLGALAEGTSRTRATDRKDS
ncbi:(2Fe-2S)-binding protein, partial [Nonomuraea lactucae]|uniref:(2Fe-2S)-binding protein n=1 Tax=Nonomuraea lactucae TaxID=2249762 RepID=UPI0019630EA9